MKKNKKEKVAETVTSDKKRAPKSSTKTVSEPSAANEEQSSGAPGRDMDVLLEVVMGAIHDIETTIKEELTKNPYKTLGLAWSIGYMIGGGAPKMRNSFFLPMMGRVIAKSIFRKLADSFAKQDFGMEDEEF